MTTSWFEYNGGDNKNPSSYTVISGLPACSGELVLCAIKAQKQVIDSVTRPIITISLAAEIDATLSNQRSSANVGLEGVS